MGEVLLLFTSATVHASYNLRMRILHQSESTLRNSVFFLYFVHMLSVYSVAIPRNIEIRRVSSEIRSQLSDELNSFNELDKLPSWPAFTSQLKSSPILTNNDLHVKVTENSLCVFRFVPPSTIAFSITISFNYVVSAFHRHSSVNINDFLGFQHRLCRWSQLEAIITRVKNAIPNLSEEIIALATEIENVVEQLSPCYNGYDFITEQLKLSTCSVKGRRYSNSTVLKSLQCFLCSRAGYRQMRKLLFLPHPDTLASYFGSLAHQDMRSQCEIQLRPYFESLKGLNRCVLLLFDEIYIKPSVSLTGEHLIGRADDDNEKWARRILAIMAKPCMGAKPIMLRLIPVLLLTGEFLFSQMCQVLQLLQSCNINVLGLMSDNHPVNRKCYDLFRARSQSLSDVWLCENPFPTCNHHTLFLLHDPVHMLKNIRNN